MNRDKQIEEMAKILCGMENICDESMYNKAHCYERNQVKAIYNAGYRKASEVVREIFEVTDEVLNDVCAMTGLSFRVYGKYAELKKKYTKEITEDK